MERTDPGYLQSRLRKIGARSRKELGQHFLVDKAVLECIKEHIEIKEGEWVVEIGPGIGVLTEVLRGLTDRLLLFEVDPSMVTIIRQDFPELHLIEGDVLQTAKAALATLHNPPYQIIANIPYQISTPLLRLFLEPGQLLQPRSMTLLIQKEVGERLAALAGSSERRYLSVLAEYYAEIEVLKQVPAHSFWPPPKVNSVLIRLITRTKRSLPEAEEKAFLHFVHSYFLQPRKQLKNVIAGIQGVEVNVVVEWFNRLQWPLTKRAQELTLAEWQQLYLLLAKQN